MWCADYFAQFQGNLRSCKSLLTKNCKEKYGFEWTKNVVTHSFRHIHISVLRNDPNVSLKEVQTRVGHAQMETTSGYTHLLETSQENSVNAITEFVEALEVV
ncbi:tyrosine-type recombinase/integrase [Listeria monocytogenes]|nr:tyrosine-type recombinase/integrase [Listeria monocytogenes]